MKKAIVVLFALFSAAGAFSQESGKPMLAILADTEQERDGLPVLVLHPDEARIARELSRGFVMSIIRLYPSRMGNCFEISRNARSESRNRVAGLKTGIRAGETPAAPELRTWRL